MIGSQCYMFSVKFFNDKNMIKPQIAHFGGLEQGGGISIANASKIPQSCTKPSIWASFHISWGWPGDRSLCDVYEPLSGWHIVIWTIWSWKKSSDDLIMVHISAYPAASMVTDRYINYMICLCHSKVLVSGNKLLRNICRSDTIVSSYTTIKDNLI